MRERKWRFVIVGAVMIVAALAFLIGIPGLGWLFVIAEALIAAVAATTLVHLGERAVHRLMR